MFPMAILNESHIRFSSGPAAANLYITYGKINYRLCFDWSFNYIYWKVGNNLDIEIDLNNFIGLETVNSDGIDIFKFACEQMVTHTQYHNYEKTNANRAKLLLLISQLKIPVDIASL